MKPETIQKLKKLDPCSDAIEWAEGQKNEQSAWNSCERGDWMLWLLGKLSGDPGSQKRRKLVLAACGYARLVLPYTEDERPKIAIETAEKWGKGNPSVTLDDVVNAADAAYAAAADAADAADAAYAAAVASADAAYDESLKQSADIVRKYYPKPPRI